MKQTTPWHEIKAEYLQGVTPKELAEKYKISGKTIREKASKEGWVEAKTTICNNLQQDIQERIKGLTNVALDALCEVINDPECKNTDKVSAARAILDISGLKSLKQDISGIEGVSVVINREAVQVESNN